MTDKERADRSRKFIDKYIDVESKRLSKLMTAKSIALSVKDATDDELELVIHTFLSEKVSRYKRKKDSDKPA